MPFLLHNNEIIVIVVSPKYIVYCIVKNIYKNIHFNCILLLLISKICDFFFTTVTSIRN